ncbi:FtsX-like permease family protein [Brevibacillus laterosporus]|nr:FtsX-like permease family protein [Brevibacillus laterosporus]TPG69077.1 FtsX-like permease family protein [Brevibacillus laterosporus]
MVFKSAYRSICRSPLRSLFTLMTIAVGMVSFFCMSTLTELVPKSVNQSAKQLLGADIAVQSYLEPTTLQHMQQIVPKKDWKALTGAFVSLSIVTSEKKTSNIIIKGVDPESYPFYGKEKFADLRGLNDDEVLLSRQAADRLQVGVGSTVSFVNNQNGALDTFRIKGLIDGVKETYTDSDFWGVAYITYPKSLELFRASAGTINEAFIQLNNQTSSSSVKEKIQNNSSGTQVTDIEDKKRQVLEGSKGTLLILQMFSLLAIAIAGVTISNTMKIMMASRLRDIAIMKSVGMTTRKITHYFLFEATLLGVVGTVVGILAGSLIGMGLTMYIAKMLSIPMTWHLSTQSVVFSLVVGISVALISAWSPIYGAVQVSPLELLRDGVTVSKRNRLPFKIVLRLFLLIGLEVGIYLHETLLASSQDSVVFKWIASFVLSMLILLVILLLMKIILFAYGLVFRLLGLCKNLGPVSWYLPLHNLATDYKKNALLTVTLSVGVLSVVASQLFTDNLIHSVERQMETQLKGNIVLSAAVVDEPEVDQQLQRTSGIEHFVKGYEIKGKFTRINGEEATEAFQTVTSKRKVSYLNSTTVSIQGIDSTTGENSYKIKDGRDLGAHDVEERTAVLLEDYKKDLGLQVGDSIEVSINNQRVPLKIVGFFESGVVKTVDIRMPVSTLETYGKPTRLIYYVEASTKSFQETLATLNQKLPSSAIAYSVNSTILESLQKTLNTQSTFFSAIAFFSFLTAVLMIGNQVVISLLQKNRDVAILKTIGMSTNRLLRSILAENLILSFIAGSIGSMFGLIFAILALSLFVKGNIDLSLTWFGIGILLSMLTTAIVTFVASLQSLASKPLQILRGV